MCWRRQEAAAQAADDHGSLLAGKTRYACLVARAVLPF